MGAHGSRESQRPKAFTKGGGDVMVSMSKPVMLDTPRRSEDDSKGLREVNSTWALFIILQVHDAGHSGALEKTFKIMQLPLTDLAVFVNVDSIFRVSLYAARDKETVQKLLDTDDYLANLEELPVMPTGTERALKSFVSDDSEPASPATSTRSSQMYADAYLAGECVVPVRAVGERFGSGMVMQWIALDSKGLRTDGCLEGDGCTQVAKASAVFRDLLASAQTELWTPKICISVRDAAFPFEDRLPVPTQVAVMKSRMGRKVENREPLVEGPRRRRPYCEHMCQGMPCLVDASNGLRCDDDEYVRALTKNLEATTRMLYTVLERLERMKQQAARRERSWTPLRGSRRTLSRPRRGSRSLTSSPNRDCILASLREYKALSVDCVRQDLTHRKPPQC